MARMVVEQTRQLKKMRVDDGLLGQRLGDERIRTAIGAEHLDLSQRLQFKGALHTTGDVVSVEGGSVTGIDVYVAPRHVDPQRVLAKCRELLAPAAVPARVSVLDSLPRTPNGKIDRERLTTRVSDPC